MKSENYQYMLSVLDKAENGPVFEETDFDREYIYKAIKTLIKKYDVTWDKDLLVPYDDELADRVFKAGLELARETGVFCLDTGRRMIWSQDELDGVLARATGQVILGQGEGQVPINRRRPDEDSRVATVGGAYGTQVTEELFVPIMLSYAQEPVIDWIDNASFVSTYGRPIRAGSPWEAVACWQEAEMSFEVVERAGRPDMPIGCAENSPSEVGELATTTYGAFRPTDWHHASFVSELKVAYAELTKAIHYEHTGAFSHNFYNPIYGGYVGGGEGMAIATVAGMILMKACLGGVTQNPGSSHAHLSCNTTPSMIASQAVSFQALSRNTNLLVSSFMRPVAGPCVRDIFYEIAALTIATVPSGIAFIEGVQAATGRFTNHITGLEARFTAEMAHAAEGLGRKEADGIVRKLADRFVDGQKAIRKGKPFDQAYDLDTLQPTAEWQQMYDEVCSEIGEEFGLRV